MVGGLWAKLMWRPWACNCPPSRVSRVTKLGNLAARVGSKHALEAMLGSNLANLLAEKLWRCISWALLATIVRCNTTRAGPIAKNASGEMYWASVPILGARACPDGRCMAGLTCRTPNGFGCVICIKLAMCSAWMPTGAKIATGLVRLLSIATPACT